MIALSTSLRFCKSKGVRMNFKTKALALFLSSSVMSHAFAEEIKLTAVSSEYGTDCVGNPFVVSGVVPMETLTRKDIADQDLGNMVIKSMSCAQDAILIGINGVTYKLDAIAPAGPYKWTDLVYRNRTSNMSVSLKVVGKMASTYDSGTECTTEFNKVKISVRQGDRRATFVGTTAGGCP